jgi:hypothetical protein
MEWRDKKVVALGERDSVPAAAIATCLATAGIEVVVAQTECFV